MQDPEQKLKERLEKIWKAPDFTSFFQKYAKRPPLNIKKGNIIFYQGDQPDRIYFIKEGFVKLYRMSEEGRDSVIYLYGPGSILGVRALTSQDERLRHSAEAITDVKIITMSRREYLDLAFKHPEFLLDLLHVFIERLNYTERKLEGFILTDATARVANFLADCAKRFGPVLPLPLTHQLIADFVGSFRETVTVALNRLQKEKILKIDRGKITILNLKKLHEHALIER